MDIVSVLLPVYNGEKYLDKSISSVLDQTYKGIRLFLVDDCSTDDSVAICKKYEEKDDRVKVFVASQNRGNIFANVNLFQEYLSKYVMCIDQDDRMELDMVETMVRRANEDNADIIVCDHFINEDIPADPSVQEMILDNEEAMEQLMGDENIKSYYWDKMYKRDVFLSGATVGIKDKDIFDDMVYMPHIFKHAKKVKVISERLYHYYSDLNPNSFSLGPRRSMRDYYLARSYWYRMDFLEKYYPDLMAQRVFDKAFANTLGAWRELKRDKKENEKNELKKLLKQNKSKLKYTTLPLIKKAAIRIIAR